MATGGAPPLVNDRNASRTEGATHLPPSNRGLRFAVPRATEAFPFREQSKNAQLQNGKLCCSPIRAAPIPINPDQPNQRSSCQRFTPSVISLLCR